MTTREGAPDREGEWAGMALLADPRRREIFAHLYDAGRPLTRDEVAAELGVTRSLAAFHLDRLAHAALVEVSYTRPPGRGGPGAGRPAKHYEARGEIGATLPDRRYRDLAGILAAAVAREPDDRVWRRVADVAFTSGAEQAAQCRVGPHDEDHIGSAAEVLDEMGYATKRDRPAHLVLQNCPFRAIAQNHPEVVCVLNERFVAGVVDGLGLRSRLRVAGDNSPPSCCVTVTERG